MFYYFFLAGVDGYPRFPGVSLQVDLIYFCCVSINYPVFLYKRNT